MALSIRLPARYEDRLENLATSTGRTKTFYILEAITKHLGDLEIIYKGDSKLSLNDSAAIPGIKTEVINLPRPIEHALEKISNSTGRSKSFFINECIRRSDSFDDSQSPKNKINTIDINDVFSFCENLPEPIIAKPIIIHRMHRALTLELEFDGSRVTVTEGGIPCMFASIDSIIYEIQDASNIDMSRLEVVCIN